MTGDRGPEKRFAVDIMLGKLAKWLRVLGFDAPIHALWERDRIDSLLAEGFVPVTRREKWRDLEGIVFIRCDRPFEQVVELLSRLQLGRADLRPFTRCSVCNAELFEIGREAAFGRVPDFVFETASDFRECPACGRIYWPGSHKARMLDRLRSIKGWDAHEEGDNGSD